MFLICTIYGSSKFLFNGKNSDWEFGLSWNFHSLIGFALDLDFRQTCINVNWIFLVIVCLC